MSHISQKQSRADGMHACICTGLLMVCTSHLKDHVTPVGSAMVCMRVCEGSAQDQGLTAEGVSSDA